MPDIIHAFFVNASPARMFEMFSTADGLNRWWTKEASGEPKLNAEFHSTSARAMTGEPGLRATCPARSSNFR